MKFQNLHPLAAVKVRQRTRRTRRERLPATKEKDPIRVLFFGVCATRSCFNDNREYADLRTLTSVRSKRRPPRPLSTVRRGQEQYVLCLGYSTTRCSCFRTTGWTTDVPSAAPGTLTLTTSNPSMSENSPSWLLSRLICIRSSPDRASHIQSNTVASAGDDLSSLFTYGSEM